MRDERLHDQATGDRDVGCLRAAAHKKDYEAGLVALPDYRITCIFVDRTHRRKGVAEVALGGALGLIAAAGGGVVEAYVRRGGRGTRRAEPP